MTEDAIQLVWAKLFIVLILFLTALAVGLIPLRWYGLCSNIFRKSKSVTGVFNSFAGGVFMAIAMLHLLPEAHEEVEGSLGVKYPLSYMISILGYLIILYVEKIAFDSHKLISHGGKHSDLGVHNKGDQNDEEEYRLKHILSARNRMAEHLQTGAGTKCKNICHKELSDYETLNQNLLPKAPSISEMHYISAICLSSALSIHAIFEGLAIGLQDNYTALFDLALAVLIHKIPEALALGVSLHKMNHWFSNILLIIFVLATPVGIGAGMIILGVVSPILEGLLISLTTGSFLYISLSEIIVEEFSISRHKHIKFLSMVFGIMLVSSIIFIRED